MKRAHHKRHRAHGHHGHFGRGPIFLSALRANRRELEVGEVATGAGPSDDPLYVGRRASAKRSRGVSAASVAAAAKPAAAEKKAEKAVETAKKVAAVAAEPAATAGEKKAAAKAAKSAKKAEAAAVKVATAKTEAAAKKAAKEVVVATGEVAKAVEVAKVEKLKRLVTGRVAARKGRKYGKYKSLVAKIGRKSFPTYVYAAPKSKKGFRHIPVWALAGGNSPRDLKNEQVAKEVARLRKMRASKSLNPLKPNKRSRKHHAAHVVPYTAWREMHANKRHKSVKHAVHHARKVQHALGIRRFPSFKHVTTHFKRNPGMATFVSTVKAAAPLTGGFAAALALTKLVSDQLHDMLAKNDSTAKVAPYAALISAAVVPAVGAMVTNKIDALPSKDQVAAGMVAAGILGVVKAGLGLAGQPAAAAYLSGLGAREMNYTNARGSNLPNYLQGVGSYHETATNGLGAFYPTNGLGAAPAFTQAAAGVGALPQFSQAAAGMGEFFAPRGVSGLGQYESKGITQAAAGLGAATKEGIMPNLHSAERALSFAEAAAGLGDLPLTSTEEPVDTYVPVDDAPQGSRAGVFMGGDGIFG
jgi:hypothetical protein